MKKTGIELLTIGVVEEGHKNGVSTPNLKRLRPRFASCKNCNEDFDVETNDKYSCSWHPGIFLSLFLDPFPAQTRAAIIDTRQGTKNHTMTTTSGPTMTRLTTEALIIIATRPVTVKGLSTTAATGMVIVEVVRRGHTERGGMYIRRGGAEGDLVHIKKTNGIGRRASHSRNANFCCPFAVYAQYLLGKAKYPSSYKLIAAE